MFWVLKFSVYFYKNPFGGISCDEKNCLFDIIIKSDMFNLWHKTKHADRYFASVTISYKPVDFLFLLTTEVLMP